MLSFAPDLDETTPEVLVEVTAVPTARGYKSPPAGVTTNSDALADPSQGAALMLKLDGTVRTISGTADALYELSSGAWVDVSDVGGYTVGAVRWWFAQFGNTTLAGNKATQLQQSASGAFAPVANSPKAGCADTCAGFLVLGDLDDTGSGLSTGYGDQSHRWWTSQLFNPTGTWAPSVATQATSGLLVDTPGAITAMKRLRDNIVAYKGKSIYVGDFVGPPVVLAFRKVSEDVGCVARDAVVAANSLHYFPGDDDFYVFDGQTAQKIGGGIREWFFARLNRAYASTMRALHDRASNLIYWWYPTGSATALTSCVVYHYPTGRWGAFDLTITDVLEAVTSAITYDDVGDLFATYDDMPPIAYNSPFWLANTPVLAYFDANDTLQSLSGTAMAMALTTGWIGSEEQVSLCRRVRPRFRTGGKPASGSIVHRHLMALGDAPEVEPALDINGDRFDVLAAGKYHQFAMSYTGYTEQESLGAVLIPDGEE